MLDDVVVESLKGPCPRSVKTEKRPKIEKFINQANQGGKYEFLAWHNGVDGSSSYPAGEYTGVAEMYKDKFEAQYEF